MGLSMEVCVIKGIFVVYFFNIDILTVEFCLSDHFSDTGGILGNNADKPEQNPKPDRSGNTLHIYLGNVLKC